MLDERGTFHSVLKMSPPLVITREQLDYAVDAIDACVGEVERDIG